jgi:DNA-binding GntR family transcriptional regulator
VVTDRKPSKARRASSPNHKPPAASRSTKKDLVAAAIRSEIVEGRLAAGTHLRQHEVASRLHVSPTPVREAFSVLALEGLVEWDAYRGVTVARDLRGRLSLADFFELRGALEILAVRVGARSPDATVLHKMEEANAEAQRAERVGDVTRWPLANSRFHASLVELARSEFLTQLMGILVRASMFFPTIKSLRVHSAHEAILRALKAGDADLALRLVTAHAKSNVATARREAAAHSRLTNGSKASEPAARLRITATSRGTPRGAR